MLRPRLMILRDSLSRAVAGTQGYSRLILTGTLALVPFRLLSMVQGSPKIRLVVHYTRDYFSVRIHKGWVSMMHFHTADQGDLVE